MRNSGAFSPTRGAFGLVIIGNSPRYPVEDQGLAVVKLHHGSQGVTIAAHAAAIEILAGPVLGLRCFLTVAKDFSLHGSRLGVVPIAPGSLHLTAADHHAPVFCPSNYRMRRADRNDNDFSGTLTDRRQRMQLGSARFTAIVHALVNLLDRLAYQYAVNCPAELAMIVRLPAGRGTLVRRADTESDDPDPYRAATNHNHPDPQAGRRVSLFVTAPVPAIL